MVGKGPKQGSWVGRRARPSPAARESALCYGSSWELCAVLEQGSDRWKLNMATPSRRLLPAANAMFWVLLSCLARHRVARFIK